MAPRLRASAALPVGILFLRSSIASESEFWPSRI
ncbi:hypothetical protein CTAM01_12135, partial [Colletotrichum tamarilloi]